MKEKGKKLTAVALATVVGLSCTGYPLHAQEETGAENTVLRTGTNEPSETSVAGVEMNGSTTYYDSLNEAVKAVGSGTATITLRTDATLTGFSADNAIAGTITLIGGDHTITGDGNGIYVSGTLTVESGQFDETATLHALGTIRINGGTIAYLSTAGGEGTKIINVYGGTIAQLDALDQGTANIYGGLLNRRATGSGGVIHYRPIFEVTIAYVKRNEIAVSPLPNQTTFGKAHYSLDQQNWQTSPFFVDLQPNTTYTVYAYYNEAPDRIKQVRVVTAKLDGSAVIDEPDPLNGTYGQQLSDLTLPEGWTWADADTDLTTGDHTYPIRFDTTTYEGQYDFTNVTGYHPDGHYVERDLTVHTAKAESSITFQNDLDLDKVYDTKAVTVSREDVDVIGSSGNVSFAYEELVDGTWTVLSAAPSGAGTYRVTAQVAADANYLEATSQSLTFTISKATITLRFTADNIDKTYDGTPAFVGTEQIGGSHVRTLSWYEQDAQGGWNLLTAAPVHAGSYKVVAAVAGDDNYEGTQVELQFEIRKAIPSYTLPTDLVIEQGKALSSISLPAGFAWKEGTQTADQLGTHTFTAVYTPEDSTNYETVEVALDVTVIAAPVHENNAPMIIAEDRTVNVGDVFDPLDGVKAEDAEDGDLTDKILVIDNTVDTDKAGTYTVTYQVSDREGSRVEKTITVTVKETVKPQQPETENDDTASKTEENDTQEKIPTATAQSSIAPWSLFAILSAAGGWIVSLLRRRKQG